MTRPEEPDQPDQSISALSQDREGLTFKEPWEAEALALSASLQEAGLVTAEEWSATLGAEIKAAQARGDSDDGTTYYRHVLAAVETLVSEKGLASRATMDARRHDWEEAYRNTPHGQPVTLPDTKNTD